MLLFIILAGAAECSQISHYNCPRHKCINTGCKIILLISCSHTFEQTNNNEHKLQRPGCSIIHYKALSTKPNNLNTVVMRQMLCTAHSAAQSRAEQCHNCHKSLNHCTCNNICKPLLLTHGPL